MSLNKNNASKFILTIKVFFEKKKQNIIEILNYVKDLGTYIKFARL